jgi:hypothetical protein
MVGSKAWFRVERVAIICAQLLPGRYEPFPIYWLGSVRSGHSGVRYHVRV